MRLEHHLVGGYVRYISPHIILLLLWSWGIFVATQYLYTYLPTISVSDTSVVGTSIRFSTQCDASSPNARSAPFYSSMPRIYT